MPELDADRARSLKVLREAMAPLQRAGLESARQGALPSTRELGQRWRAAWEARVEQSRAWAELRYARAAEINALARAVPGFVARAVERRLPDLPGLPAGPDRLRAERELAERMYRFRPERRDPCAGRQPTIVDLPLPLEAGHSKTVTGEGFGLSAGSVSLELDVPAGMSIAPTLEAWSDTAVSFQVPSDLPAGVPLRALGRLVLKRGDFPCQDSIAIELHPRPTLFSADFSFSDDGWAPFDGPHNVNIPCTSPVLPATAEPFEILGSDVAVALSSSEISFLDDSPPSFSVIEGPTFTAARERRVVVRVRDDTAWNFELTARFFIVQPANEPGGSGWTSI